MHPRTRLESIPAYSFSDVLECIKTSPEAVARLFRDQVVLVGNSLPEEDRRRAPDRFLPKLPPNGTPPQTGCSMPRLGASDPLWGTVPGVMIQAAAVDSVLAGNMVQPVAASGLLAIATAMALIGCGLGFFLGPGWAAAGLSTVLAILLLSGGALVAVGLWLPLAVPATISMGATLAAGVTRFLVVDRRRRRVEHAFGHYLAPVIVERLAEDETALRLGGESREFSVLFTDVAGFTTLCEKIDPETLAGLVNDYFEGVCAAIFAEGGMVNEFVGDSVLGFFGAPQNQPDHADRAVSAALAIDSFASRFSATQRSRGIDFGITRIGVHCGFAMVGNLGTRARLKYGALGDVLNTGSRLEGLNKTIGTRICVSGDIVRHSQKHIFRPVGSFVVKGRHGATDIFEPVDPRFQDRDRLACYDSVFRALLAGEPEVAAQLAALHDKYPDDACVAFHCKRLAAGETGAVVVMAEK